MNLSSYMREELTPTEEANPLTVKGVAPGDCKRKTETAKKGASQRKLCAESAGDKPEAFVNDTAKKTGKALKTIHRAVKREP